MTSLPSPSSTPDTQPSTPTENDAVGMSDPSLSEGRRRMLDLMNRLHNTGVQSDMDLPQIAVIGSQSAGKSSLIESISGITLPRAAGTCTRCPTECRLAYSNGPWQCSVSLRFMTDSEGQPLAEVKNEQFGPVMFVKGEVEERIRRAQRAILNPSTPRTNFLTGEDTDPNSRELSFSTNCVCLQISGKDVADLSFCDLPGLIASVGKGGNENDINMVKNLVTAYISKPSCVILSTVACETDYENQGAHHLARKYDPDGTRTIGVLTKPDRIPPGEEDRWLRFIRNEAEPLLHGWFCVKQPNSSALSAGITWAEARTQEQDYFSMNLPWSSLDSLCQKQLRTSNLMERLSSVLSELISKRLPKINEELQKLIRNTEEAMSKLPKPPSADSFGEVLHLVGGFLEDLSRNLEGTPEKNGLLQSIRPAQITFQRAIRATVPEFLPYKRGSFGKSLPSLDFLAHEETDSGDTEFDAETIYIDEVYERAQTARTRELPDNYPFVVQQTYISAITAKWLGPALNLFDEVDNVLAKHVCKLVAKHFKQFGRGGLERMIQLVVAEHLKKCAERTRDKINWLTQIEERAFTINTHYYSDYRDKFLSYYRGCREKTEHGTLIHNLQTYTGKRHEPTSIEFRQSVGQILSALPVLGITGSHAIDIAKLLPPDPMEPALNIMAGVRAYFQVAYKRFTDTIPLAIDHEFVLGIQREMRSAIYDGLKISGPDAQQICRNLGQEPLDISARRETLKNQLERLGKARHELLAVRI